MSDGAHPTVTCARYKRHVFAAWTALVDGRPVCSGGNIMARTCQAAARTQDRARKDLEKTRAEEQGAAESDQS